MFLIRRLNELSSLVRLFICLCVAMIVFCISFVAGVYWIASVMLGWNAFCAALIALSWMTFLTVPQEELSHNAKKEDENRFTTFALVLCSICLSLFGILALMKQADTSTIQKDFYKGVALAGVALSWGLLHTIFTLRYAHLFYSDDQNAPTPHTGGLDFPEEEEPDYLDFAYFSFVVGMTFQVSDVEVRSKLIRRVVLLHGFISFIFNTAIVALTISVLSNS